MRRRMALCVIAATCLADVACSDGGTGSLPVAPTDAGDASAPPPAPPVPTPPGGTWSVDAVACSVAPVADHCDSPIPTATFALDVNGTYTPPASTHASDGYAVWNVPTTLLTSDIRISAPGFVTIDAPVDVLHTHDGQSHNIVTLTRAAPAPPTRDQVLSVKLAFQGLTVTLPTYGTIPWFEPAISSLDKASRQIVYQAKHAAGDTHIGISISWAYQNDGGYSYPVPGKDLSGDLPAFRALVMETIASGFTPILFLAGDGESLPSGGYNDPNGWSYGYGWLMAHLAGILTALEQPDDLTPYCLILPGWDGVLPVWQPNEIDAFLLRERALAPNGYLGLELAGGYSDWGGGGSNYTSAAGQALDAVLQEFPGPPTGDQVWHMAARELGPAYVRPPDEPAGDDPNPPFYLAGGTPRGPWYAIAFEYDEYRWVRGQVTAPQIAAERQYLGALGYAHVD